MTTSISPSLEALLLAHEHTGFIKAKLAMLDWLIRQPGQEACLAAMGRAVNALQFPGASLHPSEAPGLAHSQEQKT